MPLRRARSSMPQSSLISPRMTFPLLLHQHGQTWSAPFMSLRFYNLGFGISKAFIRHLTPFNKGQATSFLIIVSFVPSCLEENLTPS
ncbi:hypothetical protein BJX99DRAFT_124549 [Aspergillus californicus]